MTRAEGPLGPAVRPGDPSAHQLRLFLLLADELHFGRAAQRAFMTQPAFSQQIRSLERRLGVELADRTTRTAGLTAEGCALLPEIRKVVEAADQLRLAAGRQACGPSGRVVIGSFEAVTALPPIPAILEELMATYPGIELEVLRMSFVDCADILLEGAVDAAFVFPPLPAGIQTQALAGMKRVACMAASDPLAAEGPLTLQQLSDHPHIGWSPKIPKCWRDFWATDPRPDGKPVQYTAHQVTEFEPALTAVALGDGIQLPPEPARLLYQRPGVAYVDVTDLPPCSTALAWRRQDRDRPVVAALRKAASHQLT